MRPTMPHSAWSRQDPQTPKNHNICDQNTRLLTIATASHLIISRTGSKARVGPKRMAGSDKAMHNGGTKTPSREEQLSPFASLPLRLCQLLRVPAATPVSIASRPCRYACVPNRDDRSGLSKHKSSRCRASSGVESDSR